MDTGRMLFDMAVTGILKEEFNIESIDIVGIYEYGSVLYGTNGVDSDIDIVAIINSDIPYQQYESESMDIHILSTVEYFRQLSEHKIMALECYYQKSPILKYECEFSLSLPMLRKEISSVASNSWVKAKKKLTLPDEDNYIGVKSFFHSFRIIDFGIQIAKFGEIDYESSVKTWENILSYYGTGKLWADLEWKYKQLHLLQMSEFRKLAPKA